MEKILLRYGLQKLIPNKIFWGAPAPQKCSMPIKEIEFIIENFPRKKTPGKMSSLVNCGKNLKRNTNPYIKSLSREESSIQGPCYSNSNIITDDSRKEN